MKFSSLLILIISVFISIFLVGCGITSGPKGDTGLPGAEDKMVRLEIPAGYGTTSTNWICSTTNAFTLNHFNVEDYPGVKSAFLSATLKTTDTNNTCYFELYNITDDEVVASSTITTTSNQYIWVDSNDVLTNLPSKEIELATQIRSESGAYVVCATSFLLLRR